MSSGDFLARYAGKRLFLLGDEACAWGALYAGCDFYAAYPITPASEIAETMAQLLPQTGGVFVQMEDEIASIAACIGAVWAGARAMTATSGPGFSLMQENLGYAIMTETPLVVVNVQRSGPSTGQATKGAQGDILQARWGTHGDHEIVALCPWSVEETFWLTIKAFDIAERLRTPVVLLTDGEVGHFREPLTLPHPKEISISERRLTTNREEVFGPQLVPPMARFGDGSFVHITGSTHKSNGLRDVETQTVHQQLLERLVRKIASAREQLRDIRNETDQNASVGVISLGAAARVALGAVKKLQNRALPVSFLRILTLWPFPERDVRDFCERHKTVVVVEQNLGQLKRVVERFSTNRVLHYGKIGGVLPSTDEVAQFLQEVADETA
ncbi:MAG: 2-oxoacid:acceptor oxidoreductase subunit alpha [Planctomycetota bacterium]|nr:MAG: 2-oxoacid:acceptor oxidoreductase subunit alpha [Planctomycetota bacterium]